MHLKFYYKELRPKYNEYKNLLKEMNSMSKDFFALDKIFYSDFVYDEMKCYEKEKKLIIQQMFNKILDYFPVLKDIPCAIYLSGSYARGNITAGSDVDLTFYFPKNEIYKYQSIVYMIRYAISKMLDVNIVHVHSFTKNFNYEVRKKKNIVLLDQHLEAKIIWQDTKESFDVCYPDYQMMPEREISEISSIKNIESLKNVYYSQIKKHHPKEWIYTHECIYNSDNNFLMETLVSELDSIYSKGDIIKALKNIRDEINELLLVTVDYYINLKNSSQIELASHNMIGKRTVTMLVHTFATYLRWFYKSKELINVPVLLNLDELFSYKSGIICQEIIDKVNLEYSYFRFTISKMEIWAKKCKHHYEHRSKETIKKDIINVEYKTLWKNNKKPVEEQVVAFERLVNAIKDALEKLV